MRASRIAVSRCLMVWACVSAWVILSETGLTQPRPEWKPLGPLPGDQMLAEYFEAEVFRLQTDCLRDIRSLADWEARVEEFRRQMREMLGLDPWPEKTDLRVTVTGSLEREDFIVEKLHFQSLPRLYVTANFYLPKKREGRVPAVLYVCGHSRVNIDNVSYGNKTHYHFHAVWFARHGYACLVIDTIQLGEIEGIHHGTYRYGMWWWNNRGYTPAGIEAWNCVRAIDYLQTRPEVDPERIGVTGRSGGGAYSWWIAAIDPRVKVAVPVAGITDLQDHVIDGCVEGHCDCMYFVNTYRWDYPMVAALVAPRPLLIVNGDHDPIFPEDGVRRVYESARKVYELYSAGDKIGIFITKAGHDDIPPIQEAAFRWFDRHLLGRERDTYDPVEKVLSPQELKVFSTLPEDELNTTIHEHFVKPAPVVFPKDAAEWQGLRTRWLAGLREKCFRGWPTEVPAAHLQVTQTTEAAGLRLVRLTLNSQEKITLPIYRVQGTQDTPKRVLVEVLDQAGWLRRLSGLKALFGDAIAQDLATAEEKDLDADESAAAGLKAVFAEQPGTVLILLMPRGVGPTSWNPDLKKRTQIERRFMLVGQTSHGMQIFDIVRGLQALRKADDLASLPVVVRGSGSAGVLACYATIFEPVEKLQLDDIPANHREGPYILNISRVMEVPQAILLAAERSLVELKVQNPEEWQNVVDAARALGWPADRVKVISAEKTPAN